MALSDSQRKANDKYISEHYAQVKLSMPKAEAEILKKYCSDNNMSVAGFIRSLVTEAINDNYVPVLPKNPAKKKKSSDD